MKVRVVASEINTENTDTTFAGFAPEVAGADAAKVFDSQKTFSRKIKEQMYAILVEQQFTKEQILTTYLNNVCFGCGI